MSENFSSISQVLSSPALEQKKHFEAILPRPGIDVSRSNFSMRFGRNGFHHLRGRIFLIGFDRGNFQPYF
jgi:hypothetical protein